MIPRVKLEGMLFGKPPRTFPDHALRSPHVLHIARRHFGSLPLSGEGPVRRIPQDRAACGRQTLPADRRYAVENGPSGFDPAAPAWRPKTYYLMLMRHERLAGLA